MKTIGLLGGMTWHSTLEYYRLLNEGTHARLGGSHSARCLLYSVDFEEFEERQNAGDWEGLSALMVRNAQRLEQAGADFLVICANTMHQAAPAIEAAVSIPLLHIADATAAEIRRQGLRTVGLLGTRYTMELEFYRSRVEKMHSLRVLVPGIEGREMVHRIIFQELGHGIISDSSRKAYISIMGDLQARGAEGVILGCTEIPLLVQPADFPLPLFDTTAIHAAAAVEWALA
jgi:aspartate racemase